MNPHWNTTGLDLKKDLREKVEPDWERAVITTKNASHNGFKCYGQPFSHTNDWSENRMYE